jgi:hypothetical protein
MFKPLKGLATSLHLATVIAVHSGYTELLALYINHHLILHCQDFVHIAVSPGDTFHFCPIQNPYTFHKCCLFLEDFLDYHFSGLGYMYSHSTQCVPLL